MRISSYINDLIHAARSLVKARAFTAVCVTSLGLGMGVVIAIFMFMRTVLATPPGVNEDGLVQLVARPSGQLLAEAGTNIIETWSYPDCASAQDTWRHSAPTCSLAARSTRTIA